MAKYAVQSQKHLLAGSGVTSTATSLTLRTLQFPDESNITITEFGDIGYATLEPGTTRVENISFTGITQNADGTATLTGVTRGLDFHTPYSSDSSRGKSHDGGTILIFSNSAPFYNSHTLNPTVAATVSGLYTFSTVPQATSDPVSGDDLARRSWILTQVNGGAVSTDNLIISATAGETVSAGELLYYKTSDGEWYKCDADTASTVDNVLLGIAQGAGTDGNAVTNGVLMRGRDANQSGMTAGQTMYASNTAGAIANSAGTTERAVGYAKSATELYFFPNVGALPTADEKDAMAGDGGTPSSTNLFQTKYSARFGVQQLTAGATINGGTLPVAVYQSDSDNEFYACDANDTDKLKFLGFAISNGTDGASIDVQFNGVVTGFTGLAEGEKYYVQDDSTIGTSPGTYEVLVGIAISETALVIQKGKRRAHGTLADLGTAGSSSAVTCGFRPSVVRMYAVSNDNNGDNHGVMMAVWVNGTMQAVASQQISTSSYVYNAAQVHDDSTGQYMTLSIGSVTDTGFTISWSETGAYDADEYVIWEAEGEF